MKELPCGKRTHSGERTPLWLKNVLVIKECILGWCTQLPQDSKVKEHPGKSAQTLMVIGNAKGTVWWKNSIVVGGGDTPLTAEGPPSCQRTPS